MVAKVQKSGATVLITQKGIDDLAQHYLAKAGIYAVRRAKKSDMEKLAKATGATLRYLPITDDGLAAIRAAAPGHAALVREVFFDGLSDAQVGALAVLTGVLLFVVGVASGMEVDGGRCI